MPIEFGPYSAGLTTIYIRILDESATRVWNKVSKIFETYNSGTNSQYKIQMQDPSGLGVYTTLDPIEITAAGSYPVIVYEEPATQIGGKIVGWDGTGPIDEIITVGVKSYTSPGAADVYFGSRLNTTAWLSLSDQNQKQQALNDATSIIDSFAYIGNKTVSTQAHQWPRYGICGQSSATVPEAILQAQYEIAYALLIDGVDIQQNIKGLYVTSRKYSGVTTTYDIKNIPDWLLWGIPSWLAWTLLYPFIDLGRSSTIRLNKVS